MDTDSLYDIYDFYDAPWWQNPWILVGIATAVLLTLFLVWHFYKKPKKLSPCDKALKILNTLNPDAFTHKHEFKQFYFSLTAITKTYLEERYGWQTKMFTDEELVTWLEAEYPGHKCTTTIAAMIENTLLIKFANVDAIKAHALRDKQAIIDLITSTKLSQ